MARRSIVASFLMVFLFLLAGVDLGRAQDATMVLQEKGVFQKLQRPPVTFSHEKHSESYPDCIQCHHDYEYKDGKRENLWGGEGQACSQCHKLDKIDKKLPLRTAFHENCITCHRQLEQEKKKSGPVTCGECHVRPKMKP